MTEAPGAVFEAVYDSGVTGLVGTVTVAIQDNQNNVVFGPTTVGIIELTVGGSPTGVYRANLTAPMAEGQYSILWSNDGSYDPGTGAGDDLLVSVDANLVLPPLGSALADSPVCSAWTTESAVIDCCDAEGLGTSDPLLDQALVVASELLFEASGRRYPGACEQTVRPCRTGCNYGLQVLSRGHLVGWNWITGCWGGYDCGCRPLSRVKLAGRVTEIIEVKIDGAVVDPSTYRVDEKRWLVRKDGARWPRCQNLDRDDTESGTFSVTYIYGKTPPVAGQLAAGQLACEIYKSCQGQECSLPIGVTRVTRTGITFDRTFLQRNRDGVWQSGLGLVDIFLNTFNPHGIPRRATFWGASSRNRYARPVDE